MLLMQVGDLLEKSQANKALHDKQRKATSSANFETSRWASAHSMCTHDVSAYIRWSLRGDIFALLFRFLKGLLRLVRAMRPQMYSNDQTLSYPSRLYGRQAFLFYSSSSHQRLHL